MVCAKASGYPKESLAHSANEYFNHPIKLSTIIEIRILILISSKNFIKFSSNIWCQSAFRGHFSLQLHVVRIDSYDIYCTFGAHERKWLSFHS